MKKTTKDRTIEERIAYLEGYHIAVKGHSKRISEINTKIKVLAEAIIEGQKYKEICPQTMEQLEKIAGASLTSSEVILRGKLLKEGWIPEEDLKELVSKSKTYLDVREHRKHCNHWGKGEFCLACFGGGLVHFSTKLIAEIRESLEENIIDVCCGFPLYEGEKCTICGEAITKETPWYSYKPWMHGWQHQKCIDKNMEKLKSQQEKVDTK